MDLLEKFNALTVEADNRISLADKTFCEKHQSAYEAAIQSFRELSFFWSDMEKTQRELLAGLSDSQASHMTYLVSRNGPEISEEKINEHIGVAHFETDRFGTYPAGFSDLLGYSRTPYREHEFSTCKKVKRLKMFKSGRVDIYFTSEDLAEEFVNKYLGTVC